ncbi:SagB family peptide dehydrogenase [Kitasatospora sp. NBC_00315]|uniref:SagB family peptide dehydrogenase n=1 Tax=Kitasatospora sp. NBC_00315 TaxID=2975963 RepID=UPI0032477955
MSYAHAYADAVMRRGRVPMEPADFVPDWADRPRKGKFHPGAEHFPLPDSAALATATVQKGLFGEVGDGAFTLPLLGGMLQDSYGLTGRRLAVQANSDLGTLPLYPHANWSRGTASGGGLYPIGVHWVAGPSGPLTPGVYHYSTPHHSMQRLLAGDVSGEVRAALGDPTDGSDTDQFLVLGVKFWQNAFKYNSFSYHVVTMDIGALLQTWRIWARARGLHVGAAFWFDEDRLGRLLGLSAREEGVFAVVPLRWGAPAASGSPDRRTASGAPSPHPGAPGPPDAAGARSRPSAAGARVRLGDQERSRRVIGFDTVERIHAATLEGATARPAGAVLAGALTAAAPPAVGEPRPLPAPRPLALGVREALRSRRSSFGRFTATRPMAAEELSAALAAAAAGADLAADLRSPDGSSPARLYAFVNHVVGVPAGAYSYHAAAGALRLLKGGPQGEFLQRNYFLSNYNLEQAGAVITVAAPTRAVLDAVGDRGLRLVNATVGSISQALYTAAAALDLACGVALGFDCVSYAEELGLDGPGETPLLIMMIGHERPQPADFSHPIA